MSQFSIWDDVSQIPEDGNQPEQTANEALQFLIDAAAKPLAVDLSSGNATLTSAQWTLNFRIRCHSHTVARVLTVPQYEKFALVFNDGTGDVTVTRGTGTVVVRPGGNRLIYTDGSANGIAPANIASLLDLTDTPASYSGHGGKVLGVKTSEDGTEFVVGGGGAGGGGGGQAKFVGALVDIASDFNLSAATPDTVPWDTETHQTRFKGLKFWLGADFDFVDGDVDAGTGVDTIFEAGHGFATGDGPFQLSNAGGALPTGLSAATDYWAIKVDADRFQVATSLSDALAGVAVDITDASGGGTHTCERQNRLVVPNGVSKIEVRSNLAFQDEASSVDRSTFLHKNGAAPDGGFAVAPGGHDLAQDLNAASAALEVVGGDYFEVRALASANNAITAGEKTWAMIRALEYDAFEGARAFLTADETIADATDVNVPWDAADFNEPAGADFVPFWLGPNFTFVDGDVSVSDNTISEVGHGKTTGQGPYYLTTSGALPAGLATATNYWVIALDADTIQLASSYANAIAGTAVDITDASGGGTHTLRGSERFGIPAGVARVEIVAAAQYEPLGATDDSLTYAVEQFDSADSAKAEASDVRNTDSSLRHTGLVPTGVMAVEPGDYFMFRVNQTTGAPQTLESATKRTFFSIRAA